MADGSEDVDDVDAMWSSSEGVEDEVDIDEELLRCDEAASPG